MDDFVTLAPRTYKPMPWRNGLGTTIELLKHEPPEAKRFMWRLSMADVVTDGEFSPFNGYDRTLVLLQGNGITLEVGGAKRWVLNRPLDIAEFDGGASTFATLHAGAIKDFNVMCLHDYCSASVLAGHGGDKFVLDGQADVTLLYAVNTELSIEFCGQALESVLAPRHLLWVKRRLDEPVVCRGGEFISVQLTYR